MTTTRGVLLDVDGTLLRSNDAHAAAWKRALHEQGVSIAIERIRPLIGMGADQLLPQLGLSDAEGPGKIAAERSNEIFREHYANALEPTPGARRLVERLRAEGLKTLVATSSDAKDLQLLLRAANIADLIEDDATSSDAEKSKPRPDIVEAAVARAGLPKESLVMLGDTPYDVAAARRAGVRVVCVRCGGFPDSALKGAAAIYDDPHEIADRFETSIFARGAT